MYCKQNSIFFAKTGSGTHLLKRILLVVSRLNVAHSKCLQQAWLSVKSRWGETNQYIRLSAMTEAAELPFTSSVYPVIHQEVNKS